MASIRVGWTISTGLDIAEYRLHDCGHITAHSLAVVGEYRCHSSDVRGARVTRDQVLNQLLADEGPDVWVVEYDVERSLQISLGGLAARNGHTVEQLLGVLVVIARERHHRALVVDCVAER